MIVVNYNYDYSTWKTVLGCNGLWLPHVCLLYKTNNNSVKQIGSQEEKIPHLDSSSSFIR